jgi:Tfp pilus assembly protein PilV
MRTSIDQKGSTLIQLLVAMTIVAITALVIAGLTKNSFMEQRLAQTQMNLLHLKSQLLTALSLETVCTSALRDRSFQGATATTPLDLEIGGAHIKSGLALPAFNLNVKKFEFRNPKLALTGAGGVQVFTGLVSLELESANKGEAGGGFFQRDVGSMALEVSSAGQITKCYGDTSVEFSCLRLGGRYDSAQTPACQLGWAACPVKQIPYYKTDGAIGCRTLSDLVGQTCKSGEALVSYAGGARCVKL